MQVTLSERASEIVRRQVAEGRYRSPEEAVEALIAYGEATEEEYWSQIANDCAEAERVDDNAYIEATPEYFESLRERIRAKQQR